MPEQLYGLTLNDIRWLRRLQADMDSGKVQIVRRRDTASGPNVQVVKASSATLDTSDANEDRYPGHWYERDPSTGTLTQKDAVWIVTPNGETVDTADYYEGAVQHGFENGRPVFSAVAGPGGGGASESQKSLFVSGGDNSSISSTTFADVANTSDTFTLSTATKAILTVIAYLELGPDTDTTYFGLNVRPVVDTVNGIGVTWQLKAISGGNVTQGGIQTVVKQFEYDFASGSHTIKLQAARVSTGGDGTSPTMVVRNPTMWSLHIDQGTVTT